jgi:hypothetical protein
MFASGLLRDRKDLQRQMRQDALCFATNQNGTIDARATLNNGSKVSSSETQQHQHEDHANDYRKNNHMLRNALGVGMVGPEKLRSKIPPKE